MTTESEERSEERPANIIHCPDCEKEYPRPKPGNYQCVQCFCKFTIEKDSSITIIPFFDEMKLEPILVMLAVVGVVLLIAMGDKFLSFYDRLSFFGLAVVVFVGGYKGVEFLCRRYRGVDRFFRRWSRPRFITDPESLIELEPDKIIKGK